MAATITMGSKIASLVLRVVTFVFLFISILILATNPHGDNSFLNIHAYRFAMATIVIGGAFNLLQVAFSLYHIISKSDGGLLFYFYGDKVLSYFLLAGAAAGLGGGSNAAGAALLLIAFLCTVAVSVLSFLAISNQT